MSGGYLQDSDHSQLCKELKKVSDWFTLGLNFGIQECELKRIEVDHPSARRRKQEVCATFIRSNTRASWQLVVHALDEMNEKRRAREIERKYLTRTKTAKTSARKSSLASSYQLSESSGIGTSLFESEPMDSSDFCPSYRCGCGNCSIFEICDMGCPKPNEHAVLPVYNGTAPVDTSLHYFHLETERQHEMKQMIATFGNFVDATRASITKKITVKEFAVWLKQLEAFDKVSHYSGSTPALLAQQINEIFQAGSMEEVFFILSDYWSWYNHLLVEEIINKYGDQDDRRRLDDFKKYFSKFAQNRIGEFSPHEMTFGVAGGDERKHTPVLFKVDKSWDSIHINQLPAIHKNLASILGLNPHTLYLASIRKGCILMKFLIPSVMYQAVFPLSQSQKKALSLASVMQITLWHRLECPRPQKAVAPKSTAIPESVSPPLADEIFRVSQISAGNVSAEVTQASSTPNTMMMPPGSLNHLTPKTTTFPEAVSPPLADEILRYVVGWLMHRPDCQIPHCPCKGVQQRYQELLKKDATTAQEPPKPPPWGNKKPNLHLSLSQQNLGSNEHPHWHLHTKSHIRRTQRPPLLRRRSKSVDLTPIIEMRETPVIEKHLTPTPIDENRVLRRASLKIQGDCDSPDCLEEDPNWRPPLLREISLSADNLPALCLNDCPLTPSLLRENRTLVATAISPLREQRSRWVHKPKLGTVAENSLSGESSSEDGCNISIIAASIENEEITKEKPQVEENSSIPKQLSSSTSVPESGYDTNYSDTEGSDKLSRKHLHHESVGRPQVQTSPQPPPPADERDTHVSPPAHVQGHSPTHQGRSPTHQQEYGHSHLQGRSAIYLQKYSPTHQLTQHSPTRRYRTPSPGRDVKGRSPLQLAEAVVTETLC